MRLNSEHFRRQKNRQISYILEIGKEVGVSARLLHGQSKLGICSMTRQPRDRGEDMSQREVLHEAKPFYRYKCAVVNVLIPKVI